jgi:hypothetical protein
VGNKQIDKYSPSESCLRCKSCRLQLESLKDGNEERMQDNHSWPIPQPSYGQNGHRSRLSRRSMSGQLGLGAGILRHSMWRMYMSQAS